MATKSQNSSAAPYAAPAELSVFARRALLVGLLGALASTAGGFLHPEQFLRSYLVAFLFWLGVALGSFGFLMLHHVTAGAWGLVIRRILEAASRTLPLLALLFVPLVFGLEGLYVWARPEVVAGDELLQHKAAYLNIHFFLARTVLYFAVWIGLAWMLNRWSLKQDQTGDQALARRMQLLSSIGLALYCLTATFASIDWMMSLDPHWFSSLQGVAFVTGQALAGLAFVVPVALFLARREPMSAVFSPRHFHDYGKLVLAFVMLWAYLGLSQFLIIWSGNLPEEITWYVERLHGGWKSVALVLIVFHFALPFLLLLSRDIKRSARLLSAVAVFLLVMRWLDIYWQVAPALLEERVVASWLWLEITPTVAMGGIWVWFFLRQLGRRSLLPTNDPHLPEALSHE